MKRALFVLTALLLLMACGCNQMNNTQIVATTRPVYDFTQLLCQDTDIQVSLLITENVSCLHDYSVQISQMKMLEQAELVILNGAGLEAFLSDIIPENVSKIDSSENIALICTESHENHTEHNHEVDPHIWLNVANARAMTQNIYDALCNIYPQYKAIFLKNLESINAEFEALYNYGKAELFQLSCRELITFHDGFSYFAQGFDLTIVKAVEEESGSECSAAELISLINIVKSKNLPAIFTEVSGSTSAAEIISAETGANIFILDMGMSERDYFDTMYHNIDTVKEALK